MTGREHHREAELLLEAACDYGCPHVGCEHHKARLAEAQQVHPTLALAAATALGSPERDGGHGANGMTPTDGLASKGTASAAAPIRDDDSAAGHPGLGEAF